MVEEAFFVSDQFYVGVCWSVVSFYIAVGNLTGNRVHGTGNEISGTLLWQLAGFGSFIIWLLLLAAYTRMIRFLSPKVDMIEVDKQEKNPKMKRKFFDIILQYGLIVTGMMIRWAYLCLIYLPGR